MIKPMHSFAKYQRITLTQFRRQLHGGKYRTATAARRAIGRTAWNEDTKEKARLDVNQHFDVPPAPVRRRGRAPAPVEKEVSQAAEDGVEEALVRAAHGLRVAMAVMQGLVQTFEEAIKILLRTTVQQAMTPPSSAKERAKKG